MPKAIFSQAHQWYAAANIAIEPELAEQALEAGYMMLQVDTRIDVLDLRCSQCQQWYEAVRGVECTAVTEGTSHLIGGPGPATRRKRKCPLHHVSWDDCEHMHDEPTNYGRPPMPAHVLAA